MKKLLLSIIVCLGTGLPVFAKYGAAKAETFYPFKDEETGLYGIKYQDEIVMLPYFEKLEGEGRAAIFVYQDSGKYGVFTLTGFVTPPIFDKIKKGSNPFIEELFGCINDKWYNICNKGLIEMPFECDDIISSMVVENKKDKFKYAYILKPKGGKWSVYTVGGLNLITDPKAEGTMERDPREPIKLFSTVTKSILKQYNKYASQAKKDPQIAAKLEYNDSVLKIFREGLSNNTQLDPSLKSVPIEIGGYKGVINELGIIDIPFKYRWNDDVLKRDPYNIYALERAWSRELPPVATLSLFGGLEEFEDFKQQNAQRSLTSAEMYVKLYQMALQQGYDTDCPLMLRLYEAASGYEAAKSKLAKITAENERNRNRRATIDGIGNSLVNIINSSAQIYSAATGQGGDHFSVPSSYANSEYSDNSTSGLSSFGKKNDVSEQMRCNADKKVYGRYESMISKARANGSASVSEIDEWKSKMRALRQKWESKGYSFPKSSLEN